MSKRKTLQELTLKDNFMFGAVMSDETNCRRLLELVLGFPIEKVEVSKEKSIIYHPEYKGIRLDVYAKDEKRTHYNVEMQAVRSRALGKRARYYHSQLDMDLLSSGAKYSELPNAYVIFICDFDPFGLKKYRYIFENRCLEEPSLTVMDGGQTIFLSTYGENEDDVPETLVKFLKFVKADLTESIQDFNDDFVRSLQSSVQNVKESRRLEERFMGWHEMLEEERAEGRAEGRAEVLSEVIIFALSLLGDLSDELRDRILSETDCQVLESWYQLVQKTKSLNEFSKNM